jgi:hypothetical protein
MLATEGTTGTTGIIHTFRSDGGYPIYEQASLQFRRLNRRR